MRIRAVNLRMTGCAVLYALSRQVMEAGRIGRPCLVNIAVAFQAELRNVIALEQFRVACAMRVMTACASFELRGRVFKDERPLLVGVAFEAGSVGTDRKPGLFLFEPAVRVVAIRALHHAFKNLVVKGLCKLRFCFVVASHA